MAKAQTGTQSESAGESESSSKRVAAAAAAAAVAVAAVASPLCSRLMFVYLLAPLARTSGLTSGQAKCNNQGAHKLLTVKNTQQGKQTNKHATTNVHSCGTVDKLTEILHKL